jgi:riboflavin synthase
MFSGIIEDIGRIEKITQELIEISSKLSDIKQGDSLAVNGVCLTVRTLTPGKEKSATRVAADISPETVSRTGLGAAKNGDAVNLERALRAGDRLGGHFLTGHVEERGKILSRQKKGNSTLFTFAAGPELIKFIVEKGSVGIDGISLTVASASDENFTVAVIPFTLENTTLGSKKEGESVNIEPDILAKYVDNAINRRGKLTIDFLKENGF